MKRSFGLFLGMGILCAAAVTAIAADNKDAGRSKDQAPPAVQNQTLPPQDQARQRLMNDLGLMQNQEVRVIVLQQLLNREAADLRQSQAVFCDTYKLDVEKWRKGLYRYDEKQAKFIEVPEAPQAK